MEQSDLDLLMPAMAAPTIADNTIWHVQYLSESVHPIETIRPDMGFFELAFSKKRFPSVQARFCTDNLKIMPTAEHLLKLRLSGLDPIAVSGVRR